MLDAILPQIQHENTVACDAVPRIHRILCSAFEVGYEDTDLSRIGHLLGKALGELSGDVEDVLGVVRGHPFLGRPPPLTVRVYDPLLNDIHRNDVGRTLHLG